jgi:hypothetical protein
MPCNDRSHTRQPDVDRRRATYCTCVIGLGHSFSVRNEDAGVGTARAGSRQFGTQDADWGVRAWAVRAGEGKDVVLGEGDPGLHGAVGFEEAVPDGDGDLGAVQDRGSAHF